MQYADRCEIKPGDVIQIDSRYHGTVVASMDHGEYLRGQEQWSYLKEGIMVDTDFGRLVHYTKDAKDDLVLIKRADSTSLKLRTRPQAAE